VAATSTAVAHAVRTLVDRVLPDVPYAQWVLTLAQHA